MIQLSRRAFDFARDFIKVRVVGTLYLGTIDKKATLTTMDGVNDLVPFILNAYVHLGLESIEESLYLLMGENGHDVFLGRIAGMASLDVFSA